jgi:diguanylate cyclase (GGDEF)-like protein
VVFSAFGFLLGRQADQLATLSRTDPLTGLLNARGLFERVNSELVRLRRRRAPLAMFVIDLDGLKTINDRHGHRAGDDALRSLAAVIRSQLRTTDVGARWGGDEFAILASNTSASAALAVAERIRALILQQSAASPLSASIGVATIDPSSERVPTDCDRLMRAADGAMYEAKQRGRNNVVLAKGQDQDGP